MGVEGSTSADAGLPLRVNLTGMGGFLVCNTGAAAEHGQRVKQRQCAPGNAKEKVKQIYLSY
jgi:hypothetical protein